MCTVNACDVGQAVGRVSEHVVRVAHECNADTVRTVAVMQRADTIETNDGR